MSPVNEDEFVVCETTFHEALCHRLKIGFGSIELAWKLNE